MSVIDAQPLVQMVATIIGIAGGLIALYKYFSDRREKELREWQKVVIYKIFRQNEMDTLVFTDVLGKYRSEAQAFTDVDFKKKESSEDALRRVLLELASTGILNLEPSGSYRLKLTVEKPDPFGILQRMNQELEGKTVSGKTVSGLAFCLT